jgi:hypothetical protein
MAADELLLQLMRERADLFATVLEKVQEHEIQILYTQIDRDGKNCPHFVEHVYRVDAQAYFYPASTIKLAGAMLALEKLCDLGLDGLDRDTPLRNDSAPDGVPTIAHYIRKLFAVSDNDAYNRLYEFVGQQQINEGLWQKGYEDVRLTHRLSLQLLSLENRHTNPFVFYRANETIYQQPPAYNTEIYRAVQPLAKGVGYIADGRLVDEPKDFAGSNYMSVRVLQDLLKAVVFPHSTPLERRFRYGEEDRRFLLAAMSNLPRECGDLDYDREKYYDSYVKFFMFGDSKAELPAHIRSFNKVGLAYGYLIDNAYIVDFKHSIEFLLTAVVYVNKNGIFNDGKYEYDEVAFPFLANLGRVVYEHELARERPHQPDLSEFVFFR